MFGQSKNLYLDFVINKAEFVEDAKIASGEHYVKTPVPANCFRVSQIVHCKKDGGLFDGCFFYNQLRIPVTSFSIGFNEPLYGMMISHGTEPLFVLPYPEPLIISELKGIVVNENKYSFALAEKSMIGHFGTGTYAPELDELMEQEKQVETKGCPYSKPETCTWYKKDDGCAFQREDNVCKKVVGMTGKASVSIKSKI